MWKCDLYLRMLKCSCVPNDTSNYYISCTLGNVVPSMECTLLCLSILKVLFIFFTSKWNLISKTQVCFFAMPNYNSKEQYSQPYLENLLFLPWTLVLFSNRSKKNICLLFVFPVPTCILLSLEIKQFKMFLARNLVLQEVSSQIS